MSKGLRFSEKWFQRGLWLIAVIFALFLVGLGGLIVDDLPRVEQTYQTGDFVDQAAAKPLKDEIKRINTEVAKKKGELETAKQGVTSTTRDVEQGRQSFETWRKTRTATGDPGQDPELTRRTHDLDALVAKQRDAERTAEALEQGITDLQQQHSKAATKLSGLTDDANARLVRAERWQEMRIFGIRLAFTLPPLLIAGWLLLRYRRSSWWPFVWGFTFFALFGFFVELVPYLPSYGGYVRYLVGIVVTLVVGRYVILALQRYLARQREVEAQPDEQRREALDYELAHTRMIKNICPGCERAIDTKDTTRNFCTHCGICLFDHCQACSSRKNAFARFCFSCGAPARNDARPDARPHTPPPPAPPAPDPAPG